MTQQSHATQSAHESHEPKPPPVTTVDISHELEAIRRRLAERRNLLILGGDSIRYNSTDLGDAEWLLVELDKALGHPDALTPAEAAELAALLKKRKLGPEAQPTWDRIQGLHGEMTPEDLVMRDHLVMKLDAMLNGKELVRFRFLSEKAAKMAPAVYMPLESAAEHRSRHQPHAPQASSHPEEIKGSSPVKK